MSTSLRERVKRFRIAPFVQELVVIVTNDIRASVEKRKRPLGEQDIGPLACAVTVMPHDSTYIYMFLPEDCALATIVHESIHVVANVMRQNGISFEEEIWAYHMDELFDVIAIFLHTKSKKKGKKNGIRSNERGEAVLSSKSKRRVQPNGTGSVSRPIAEV